jgi:hypothetical protein
MNALISSSYLSWGRHNFQLTVKSPTAHQHSVRYITILPTTSCPHARKHPSVALATKATSVSASVQFLLTEAPTLALTYRPARIPVRFTRDSARTAGRDPQRTIRLQRNVTCVQIFRYQNGIVIIFRVSYLTSTWNV